MVRTPTRSATLIIRNDGYGTRGIPAGPSLHGTAECRGLHRPLGKSSRKRKEDSVMRGQFWRSVSRLLPTALVALTLTGPARAQQTTSATSTPKGGPVV